MENSRDVAKQTLALVLAGGRGSRLHMLTDSRAKPAVFFGGKFRIIDFALSNCVNSGITRIGVVTQYKSHSLLRHIQSGWSFLRGQFNEFVDLLPAQQRVDEEHWYQGTADAVYQNIDIIRNHMPKYIVILSADHIYKMDYTSMVMDHIKSGCPVTVACIAIPRSEASAYGIMQVDNNNMITDFLEKPADPPGMPNDPDRSLASMGIYVFNAEFLYNVLNEDARTEGSRRDFGFDIIPKLVKEHKAHAHDFSMSCIRNQGNLEICYWRDVGTIDAYWEANMDVASVQPQLDVYDTKWPIWTHQDQLPPAKYVQDISGASSVVMNSVCSAGCIISGSSLCHSVLFSNSRVHSNCCLNEAVILPSCVIHRGCRLTKVVLDRGCELPRNLIIGENETTDARRFFRTAGGVVLVTREMLEKLRVDEPHLFDGFEEYSANSSPIY
ncbi:MULTISPECIES: glucose-1-phosphate adenylyltransferase [unclassified Anaerobiospirillum]|uniref:glucose-1-phosphate adenylyltransferase n=1 Tax=unclassified Anaerobiospirillum TaxID=2647410 RepID=UPI001FF57E1D|nr:MULTISPECIES: glucose-1-phosphate adenylyltransferase [unclassified Anaerobiospirillum]MCK0525755.1 glucose-1-phosphate adenylyltransferase [Anaerobiospirillum sp. NML120449]MCK0535687.1 glucose-1-phosphate adenylyltransferase [Anaerobiospirillum sp. NML120511]MCK0540871.1 glucose-1-phosphate adenylyltransferase [Anaerobiospirillum sp. NML02-A-032]